MSINDVMLLALIVVGWSVGWLVVMMSVEGG